MKRLFFILASVMMTASVWAEDFSAALQKAQQGDVAAQQRLGYMYEKGKDVTQDYTQAVYWYRKSAEQGYVYAQYAMGRMYRDGTGVSQDYTQAASWFRKAATQKLTAPQYELGLLYEEGLGVSQDDLLAFSWYRQAAERGYVKAQFKLGSMYEKGKGVPQDYKQAAYWYKKAADKGNADAQNSLGVLYYQGNGVDLDYVEAAYWFKKAADKGHAEGETNYKNLCAEAEKYTPAKYVDLGLPSGTQWQDKNALNILNSEYSPQIDFNFDGGSIPTADQFKELYKQCTWTWDGKGYTVTGKNGNSIYLPAAGYLEFQQWYSEANPTPEGMGELGWYWTSTRTKEDSDDEYYALVFDKDLKKTLFMAIKKATCLSVRLVRNSK